MPTHLVAVVSLSSDQVRPVGRWEIAHVRMVTRS
jgi:hypothetical protein